MHTQKISNPIGTRHTTPSLRHTRSAKRSAGFTLIEILVVISIITILIGILVAAFANRQGPASATRITLAALKAAATEFEVTTGDTAVSGRPALSIYSSPVPTNYAGNSYIDPATNPTKATIGDTASGETDFINFSITRFCHQLLKYPTTNKMLMSLGRDAIGDSDGDGFADVIDGWGTKVVYYNPAEDFDPSTNKNASQAAKFPVSRTPYFASAGFDGDWGDYSLLLIYKTNPTSLNATQKAAAIAAQDNDYSFDLGH